MEKKKYIGARTGESGGFDGFAGLRLDETYTGTIEGERVHITLPNERTTSVSLDQWERWFK